MATPADALVVVDVQRVLVEGEHAVPGAPQLLATLGSALRRARDSGVPVVHLRDAGKHDRLIRHGSPGWELALEAEPGEQVIDKEHDDGFVGTSLAAALSGVARPCLVGIQSEMCVAATARGALARGLVVVLPRDGHATYDVPADGLAPAVPAAHVARVAEWSLGDTVLAPDRLADVSFG